MIYEIRMNVFFLITQMNSGDNKKTKTTLIDYIEADGVAEAFNKAAEYKHEVIIKIAKGESELFTRKAWDNRSDNISISLDAVVAKPEIILITARKEGKSNFLKREGWKEYGKDKKRWNRIAKETGIPVATLIQLENQDYRVVKLEE